MSNEKRSSWNSFTWQRSKGDQTDNGEISVVGVSQYAKPKSIREQPQLQSDGKLSKYEGGKAVFIHFQQTICSGSSRKGGHQRHGWRARGRSWKNLQKHPKPLIFCVPSHEYGYLSLNIIKNDFLICLSLSGRWDLGKNHPYVILVNVREKNHPHVISMSSGGFPISGDTFHSWHLNLGLSLVYSVLRVILDWKSAHGWNLFRSEKIWWWISFVAHIWLCN